ncbi:MAG: 3-phosphoshikimate 1-carboxyvinyltransferase [Planctomycetes bacterium]|nr:3-phosphoshikimate 1-carboxyvinyltransferase [Planctomycetota bacterium]
MRNGSDPALLSPAPGAVVIHPMRRPVGFTIPIPGSKSQTNRALLLAGAASGSSTLTGIPNADDTRAALSVLQALGIPVEKTAPDGFCIRGTGLEFPIPRAELDIRSSGTVARFLPGLLAAAPTGEWRLRSSDQLARRPLSPLIAALTEWGARITSERPDASFPLTVRGGGLAGGPVTISAAASSQFASGLLLAAPLCRRQAVVTIESLDPDEAYIDLTLELMRAFGIESASEKSGSRQVVTVAAPQSYRAASVRIEADYNSALYFLALPLVVGGTATVSNLTERSEQPGRKFLAVLSRLGAKVTESSAGVSVTATGGLLRGGFDLDMRAMAEMALTLGVLAVFADAPITMTNLSHIRGHETDRLTALADLLRHVGVATDVGPDWIRIRPRPRHELPAATIDSRDDHRLVMSFALLALGGNGLTITNPAAVAKTFPDFFTRLTGVGATVLPV